MGHGGRLSSAAPALRLRRMTYSIRGSLLAVALLGVATCALALYSLARPLAMADEHRVARARDAVALEVQGLVATRDTRGARPEARTFGLRSGLLAPLESPEQIDHIEDRETSFELVGRSRRRIRDAKARR